ncbi:MAG: FHA domain-containing protein [Betaproteobacteria bacterium]|nr:MAG: FHA domain-containing protein [Betaproteobacteria bacterium]
MAKLILSMDGLVLKEIQLSKERTTIGRKPHNDIQIDNLAVSGEHAVIVTILADSFLEDLGSTNGTFVNGKTVKKHFLQNNDVIELGKYKLKYMAEAQPGAVKAADFEKTMILRPGAMRKPPAPAAPAPAHVETAPAGAAAATPPADAAARSHAATQVGITAASVGVSASTPASVPTPTHAPSPAPAPAAPARHAMLKLMSGGNAGKELELTKPLTTLGKPGVQVAVITRRPQGFFITHVEGANKPIVNGKPIEQQAHALNDHDVIELAGVKVEFFFKR